MTSEDSTPPSVPVYYGSDKSRWKPIGCRVRVDHLELIDDAAGVLKLKRAHFIHQTLVEAATRVLAERSRRQSDAAA